MDKVIVKANLNECVYVKITDRGKQIIGDELRFLGKPNENGEYKIQMWLLMQLIGQHMYVGVDPPIEPNYRLEVASEDMVVGILSESKS